MTTPLSDNRPKVQKVLKQDGLFHIWSGILAEKLAGATPFIIST